ncbi:membrane protein implicated in regulation of membrane protease activity [Flavimobilis soli]|uniref:Membrane protein implicated in regulation of membrane protease activity n=1 Tax=Flavimobilis soli TaxID=442709 RepID=A0A2A9EC34_9MICO|nr:NfeD family protein [Flavimobilis soli]PFG35780.1 membrane protein implicated in regulation of membrane protease activity [Flavimobilis soli]
MDWYWWLVIMFALVAIEALTLDLVLFMFAGGTLAAGIASAAGLDLTWQVVAFAVVSAVLLAALRPFLLKNLRARGEPLVETNAAANVGREAIVVQEVTSTAGLVKLRGEVWTARADDDGVVIPAGAEVVVRRIDGATAVVEPQQQSAGA